MIATTVFMLSANLKNMPMAKFSIDLWRKEVGNNQERTSALGRGNELSRQAKKKPNQ
jgi:hypothetical protein